MKVSNKLIVLLLSLAFIFVSTFFSFEEKKIFWHLYTFTLLVGIAIAILFGKFKDELPTWKYILFGIGFGTITYGVIRLGYILLKFVDSGSVKAIKKFLATYGPNNIWHYLLLVFIIVIGEELFWRGYVQNALKQYFSPILSCLIASILFAVAIALGGSIPVVICAFLISVIFGLLYEWKQSMPLVIVAHEVFVLLLFLILPFIRY
ncbi:type II CAAX endopeptidase family protein [Ureibacillus sp. FSL K6-8385]|uniref:CPBP family intramembrane metalloprotease n=1 Tax=Ureibacillus terrenus TaxID=118246 RepID=A0A540UZ23_9BACL|nr:type II CAAX endopeptidase family protein [Ureibacillus terrenus]MED3661927.1 type II CAAX endopeptidase family protein [Ureibacillus terrenus]MED3765117.1 type II CAAX endopeptidase family protein [Ureibacillus terrenus]TQE89708.1 CPBP family intramembrane metalloprotease [Ureibacillus terrenus]